MRANRQTRSGLRATPTDSRRLLVGPRLPSPAAQEPCYYANIRYRGHWMGLLIETDDEEIARQEAEELCSLFDGRAVVCSVTRVMIQ
jgi:hypothetical protein